VVDRQTRPAPEGLEAAAYDAVLPGVWCCEAGQAAFGDALGWFLNAFPKHRNLEENFAIYDDLAASLTPGENGLIALDWFNGNRVPYCDASLSGALIGLNIGTKAEEIYRALVESLCYGARYIVDLAVGANIPIARLVLTGNMTRNRFLMQTLSDVTGRDIEASNIDMPTALGAAIHGAVCAAVAPNFEEGAARFGSADSSLFRPSAAHHSAYQRLFAEYVKLLNDEALRKALKAVRTVRSNTWNETETEKA
jgi:L-ribulokinase